MQHKILYILSTIAVLSVLIAFLVNTGGPRPDKMTSSQLTTARLNRIHLQLLNFYSANHRWPTPSSWKQDLKPYLEADHIFPFDKVTVDGWGSQIQCVANTNGNGLILYSFGKNRTDDHGSNDDIAVVVDIP